MLFLRDFQIRIGATDLQRAGRCPAGVVAHPVENAVRHFQPQIFAGFEDDGRRYPDLDRLAYIGGLERWQIQAHIAPTQGDLVVDGHVQVRLDGQGNTAFDLARIDPLTANRLGNAHRCQALVFIAAQRRGLAAWTVEFDLHVLTGRYRWTPANLHDPVVNARGTVGDKTLRHPQLHRSADIAGRQHAGGHVAVVPEQFDQVSCVHGGVGRHIDQQVRRAGDVNAGLVGLRQGRGCKPGFVRGAIHEVSLKSCNEVRFWNIKTNNRTEKPFITLIGNNDLNEIGIAGWRLDKSQRDQVSIRIVSYGWCVMLFRKFLRFQVSKPCLCVEFFC
ncbi:hypothetical protein D9M71_360820 [compost metagenome]